MAIALFVFIFAAVASTPLGAQQKAGQAGRGAAAPAPAPAKQAGALAIETTLTATSANVAQSGTPVKIQILKWSTDEDRSKIITAFNAPARQGGAPATSAAAAPGAPPADGGGDAAAGGAGARAAGAGRGGGRAGGRGGRDQAPPLTPEQRLAAAITAAPTVGYIWTNDVTGYSIKYAYRIANKPAGDRIILVTDRRLGMYNSAWKPAGQAAATDYEFTLVELHVDAKGAGEGKTSLAAKVVVDAETQTLALDNYAAAPAQLANVKRQSGS
jgi:hypothetical protein